MVKSSTAEPSPDAAPAPARRQHVGAISRAASTYKRKKTSTACQVCRVRRTKCDDARPCFFCRTNGLECLDSPSAAANWDPATLHILDRLQGIEDQLARLPQSQPAELTSTTNTSSPACASDIACCLDPSSPLSLRPRNLGSVLCWTPLQQLPDIDDVAHESNRNMLLRHTSSHHQHPSGGQAPCPDLEYPNCRRLIAAFFAYVHPKNPIMDEANVLANLKHSCFDGFGWHADHALLLLLLANGALATPFGDQRAQTSQPDLDSADALFKASQKRFRSHADPSDLVHGQYLFYTGVYLMTTLRPFDAWRSFLEALAICQALPTLATRQPEDHEKQRYCDEQSLYWSCWKSERELRMELDLPDFGTTGLDHPQMYPSLPHGCEGERLRAWYFYLAEISLWRLQNSAMNDIVQIANTETNANNVLTRLAALVYQQRGHLQSWQSALPPVLKPSEGQEPCVLLFVLQGRLTYNRELLTWPFLHATIHSTQPPSPQIQQFARDALASHLERLTINKPGFFHRHHGTWLMMRSSAKSACIVLAAALSPTTSHLLPDAWIDPVWDTIEMLDYWNTQGGSLDSVAALLRRETAIFGPKSQSP